MQKEPISCKVLVENKPHKKERVLMSNITTELTNALVAGIDLKEVIRPHIEAAINELLKEELTSFLGYGKHSPSGHNSGNSRNGSYTKTLASTYGKLKIDIPKDRNGEFEQKLVPAHARKTADLETMVITLYKKGITTREIADLIERMYGSHYSPTTISNISKELNTQVKDFRWSRRNKGENMMRGYASIYVNQKTGELCIVESHVTKIGYNLDMGELIKTTKKTMKAEIKKALQNSLVAYKIDVPSPDWYKKTKYKTWNKFFKEHQYISCCYDAERKEYNIELAEKETTTHSYGATLPNCSFTISDEDFDEKFDAILEFLLSKVEYFPEK